MDLGLKDKVVVVTGASKGIGLATARLLLQEGAKVAICSVTESHLREAEQELSRLGAVYAEVVDMTQEQSVYAFADHVVEKLGPIDSWVNNVGAQLTKGPDEEEYSEQTGKSQAACIQRDAQCPGYLIAKEEKNYTQHNAMPELHPGPSLPLVIRYFYCTVPAAPRQHTKCTIPCKENCVPFRQS